jgi:iron complex outermembrane receptor protein
MLKLVLFASASIISCGLSASAFAADSASDSGVSQIEQVVVTAERTEERAQDVPISMTIFNQQDLTNRNVVQASDLANYTPSLSTDTRFGSDNAAFSIRGFTQEIRTTPSVGVYFADVVEPRGGSAGTTAGDGAAPGDLFDMQNVQVLKGPQGTLFGRNTTGGAMLLVPQKPTDEFGGYLELTGGDYGLKGVQGVINIPVSDNFRLRIGVDHQQRDGYLNNISGVGPGHYDDLDYTAVRVSADWDITPNLNNYTIARFTNSDHNGSAQQLFACNANDPRVLLGELIASWCTPEIARLAGRGYYAVDVNFPNPRSFLQQWQAINQTTWAASDNLTIKNIVSYGQFKSQLRGSIFGEDFITPATIVLPGLGSLSTGSLAGLPLTITNSNPAPNAYTADQSTLTEELQFQGNGFGNKLTWQAGLYMELSDPINPSVPTKGGLTSGSTNDAYCSDPYHLQCTDILGSLLFGIVTGGMQGGLGSLRYRDYAGYAQASYDLTDELKLTGGIRFTRDQTDGVSNAIVYNFPTPNNPVASCPAGSGLNIATSPECRIAKSQTSQAPTWVAELQYSPQDNLMFYGKYARGYRQGSVSPTSPPGLQSFGPEKVDTYEVGAKTSWDGKIPGLLDIAAFYNDFSNQQIQTGFEPQGGIVGFNLAASNTTAILNAGKSRIWGVEVNASIAPFDGFRLDASYSYLNTLLESLDLTAAQATANADGFSLVPTSVAGRPLPMTPQNKLTLTGTYTLPVPDSYGRMSVAATYSYVGSELTAVDPVFTLPGGVLVGSPYGRIPPINLVNFNFNWAGINGGPVDLSAFVTNALGLKYETYVPGLYTGLGFESHDIGEPRMWGIRLRYNFGGG